MSSALLVLLLLTAPQSTPVELTAITLTPDSRVDIPLVPIGEIEARGEATVTRLRVRVDRTDVLTAFGPTFPAIVVWAVSPEGEFRNLGELELDGRRAQLETTTAWHRFGIFVTAEPHHLVDAPGVSLALKSGPPRNDEFRLETLRFELGKYDYPALPAPPPGTPSRIAQARLAYSIATQSGAETLAPTELRAARVALDSMEELVRRNLSTDLLIPYVNDAIRLADRATRTTRARSTERQMEELRSRSAQLERDLEYARLESTAIAERQQALETLRTETLSELQQVRGQNRSFRLENDDLERRLRSAESDIVRLGDPWPPLRTALSRTGARETARGMVMTIPGDQIGEEQELGADAMLLLERLIGVLALGDLPEIRIEGHTETQRDESASLVESMEMAETVKDYLVRGGIPADGIQTSGLGHSRPPAGVFETEEPPSNRRVEIILRAVER